MAEEVEACSAVHLARDPLGLGVDAFGAPLPPCRTQAACELLDQATDPPLGAHPEHVPRPQANTTHSPGDTLILYTDGLIERRGEDIDTGLTRLTASSRPAPHLETAAVHRP